MPFKVIVDPEEKGKWRLMKLKRPQGGDSDLIRTKYLSKESAIEAAKNFMRYRGEKPVVKGNKILSLSPGPGSRTKKSRKPKTSKAN